MNVFNVTLVKVCKLNSGIARRKYRAFAISTEACKKTILSEYNFMLCRNKQDAAVVNPVHPQRVRGHDRDVDGFAVPR